MKILVVSNMYPSTNHSLYGVFVKNIVMRIEAQGCDVTLVAIKGRGIGALGKVKKYLSFLLRTWKAIQAKEYDLIYVHYLGHSLIPFLLTSWQPKPLVVNAHGTDVITRSRLGMAIQKLVTPIVCRSKLIISPSDFMANKITERFHCPREKVYVYPSGGIDLTLFRPLASQTPPSVFRIGYVSRIDEGKGWNTLLMAISKLITCHNVTNFTVVMAGAGSQSAELIAEISKLNLKNHVEYVGGVEHVALPMFYQGLDVFVFPTELQESLGLVGLEAMACAVPIIGSDIGALRSYIVDGKNGFTFQPGKYEELAEKLIRMLNMTGNEKALMRTHALETANQYSHEKVTAELMKKLRQIAFH